MKKNQRMQRIKEEVLESLWDFMLSIRNIVLYILAGIILLIGTMFLVAMCDDSDSTETHSNNADYYVEEPDYDAMSGATEETEPDYSDYNISGIVKNVYIADNGDPSYIDLDYEYPDKRRISVIIWPENLDKFETLLDHLMYDDKIYIKGELGTYKGVKQVELHDTDQVAIDGF